MKEIRVILNKNVNYFKKLPCVGFKMMEQGRGSTNGYGSRKGGNFNFVDSMFSLQHGHCSDSERQNILGPQC